MNTCGSVPVPIIPREPLVEWAKQIGNGEFTLTAKAHQGELRVVEPGVKRREDWQITKAK